MIPNDAPIEDHELVEGAINSIFNVESDEEKEFWGKGEPREDDDE